MARSTNARKAARSRSLAGRWDGSWFDGQGAPPESFYLSVEPGSDGAFTGTTREKNFGPALVATDDYVRRALNLGYDSADLAALDTAATVGAEVDATHVLVLSHPTQHSTPGHPRCEHGLPVAVGRLRPCQGGALHGRGPGCH